MKSARRIGIAIVILAAAVSAAVYLLGRKAPSSTPPGIGDSSVFFELLAGEYGDASNRELMPHGRIRLDPLGTEAIGGFDWRRHARQDLSWWVRMENFVYLVTFLDSKDAADRRFAKRWFDDWYAAHEAVSRPNPGTWDPMTAGQRGMVFVWLLRQEEEVKPRDDMRIGRLRESIRKHRDFLKDPENFDSESNHGMWESMGLFEMCRVFPDPELSDLGLERLLGLVRRSVSPGGMHNEHAPGYHFVFWKWLSEYVTYLKSLKRFSWDGLETLSGIEANMRDASYFLHDHDFNVPQIGDTDAQKVPEAQRRTHRTRKNRYVFDRVAGYAIFKDPLSANFRRYAVFNVQNVEFPPQLPHHIHNDLMAVYFSYDGEVILSDQGRYSYSRSPYRGYLMSAAAHNSMQPVELIRPKSPGLYLADDVWMREDSDGIRFGARARPVYQNIRLSKALQGGPDARRESNPLSTDDAIRREVTVPEHEPSLIVSDDVESSMEYIALWHLGPDIRDIRREGETAEGGERTYVWRLTTLKGREFAMSLRIVGNNDTASEEVRLVQGETDPPMGWYSAGYNQLVPSPVIRVLLKARDRLQVTTRVETVR
jgi:hypothetical protein